MTDEGVVSDFYISIGREGLSPFENHRFHKLSGGGWGQGGSLRDDRAFKNIDDIYFSLNPPHEHNYVSNLSPEIFLFSRISQEDCI